MSTLFGLRSIQLRVADLARSVEFYTSKLGFVAAETTAGRATLAAGVLLPPCLVLTEDRQAAPASSRTAGLFHAAFLLPSRGALGRWLQHAASAGVAFDGFSDHGVSEAIYLADPDGNGLEFYTDRPRAAWPFRNGELAMGTLPLDVSALLAAGTAAELDGSLAGSAILQGASWGHLHLRVSNVDRSSAFYIANLGLSLMQKFGPAARFLAVDGYHHHLGLNSWGGIDQPQPREALGLINATFIRAGQNTDLRLVDPDSIEILVAAA